MGETKPRGDLGECQRNVVPLNTAGEGISIIARDDSCSICGGRHDQVVGGLVDELEALALVEGISLAVDMGCNMARVDSDSATVINHLKGTTFS